MALALSSRSKADDTEMMSSMKRTTKTYTYKQDSSGNITRETHTKVDCGEDASIKAMRRYEEQIRVLQDDYESEQHLRRRVEREKQDLQMQILSLTERLTQAEGGAECQLDINRKREAEMAHLRKLLEEVHTESERNIHELKKRHQQAMMELQEQIESVARSKDKVSKEKSKLQVEIESLMAQIEVLSSDKTTVRKTIERLEVQVNEYNCKIDVMCKELTAVTSERNSLKLANDESNRKLNEMKIAIESAGLDKNKVSSQLRDLQSHLDNASRGKNQAESRIVALETQLKSLSVEIQEYKETRIELEKQLSHFKNEGLDWKKKYENEARLRIEDVDTLKKKFGAQVADLQDQLDAVLSKLKAMEQAKNRLQMEVQTLIKDLEISQSTVKEFQSKLNMSEKKCEDLAIKLREMTNMYEKADNEVKVRGQELMRLSNDNDRLKMDNGVLSKDRAKLEDECRMLKAELDSIKRQLHAAEQENRKLGHDREELAKAFKDADNGRHRAEARIAELEAELKRLRGDSQKLLIQKEDEHNAVKKKLVAEIESLTARLHETENRLKNEVEKMKKKMAVTITELEMSLDSANKSNVNLQNVNKTQATKIMELTSMYESACKKLDVTVGDASALNKKVSVVENELQSLRSAHGNMDNARRTAESKVQELNVKINELNQVNININNAKSRLEKELVTVTNDYTDIAKELKLADDRANKASHDAQHFESLLREENAKLVRIDHAKQALECEVKSLTVKMEEIETTAISTSKRAIKQLEIRIEELESIVAKEKASHVETATMLHKKERVVKELLCQSEEDRKNILILQESLDRLNDKIKMYKRQLEEQESISNSNIMRVKKFQRELEDAAGRAEEAESSLNSFRSRQRVYAAAESNRRENVRDEVEREVIIKKNVTNCCSVEDICGQLSANKAISGSSSSSKALASSSAYGMSSSGVRATDYRGSSVYSRAGSMARAGSVARAGSMARAGSIGRATSVGRSSSVFRY